MSTLETNSIGKYSGNNVSIDDALNLKSYTTTQRDALTSVAGDSIYNTTTGKVEYYNGSAWQQTGADTFSIEYLVVAGGGGGGGNYTGTNGYVNGSGGGAGGYRNSYASETSGGNSSTEPTFKANKSVNYTVSVGGGGTGVIYNGAYGSESIFSSILSLRGGSGGGWANQGQTGASRGGNGSGSAAGGGVNYFITSQGSDGGDSGGSLNTSGGGGGGASASGSNGSGTTGGAGGNGLSSSITGSSVTRAGGGGGAGNSTGGSGGTGGGGAGSNTTGTAGTTNTGGGGGGSASATTAGANGGSGIVILRYATADATISVGAGLTSSSATDGSDTVVTFTAGTGTVSFS